MLALEGCESFFTVTRPTALSQNIGPSMSHCRSRSRRDLLVNCAAPCAAATGFFANSSACAALSAWISPECARTSRLCTRTTRKRATHADTRRMHSDSINCASSNRSDGTPSHCVAARSAADNHGATVPADPMDSTTAAAGLGIVLFSMSVTRLMRNSSVT